MNFIYFFPFIFISWRLITLQYCSGFCQTLTWISHGFTYIPHPNPPSHLPLYPIPLGLPSGYTALIRCFYMLMEAKLLFLRWVANEGCLIQPGFLDHTLRSTEYFLCTRFCTGHQWQNYLSLLFTHESKGGMNQFLHICHCGLKHKVIL